MIHYHLLCIALFYVKLVHGLGSHVLIQLPSFKLLWMMRY